MTKFNDPSSYAYKFHQYARERRERTQGPRCRHCGCAPKEGVRATDLYELYPGSGQYACISCLIKEKKVGHGPRKVEHPRSMVTLL